ncbi:MAG: glycogen/starch synthase, partial [Candidatus Omnitrophica bacterium]|nr:glycogen/starch synthase [Candidatus Omnitrophota bacterium]
MNKSLNILFVSPEVFPFARTGGLADVSRSLPKALVSLGHDVRVIMPFYRCVSESGFKADKLLENIRHPVSGRIFGFDLFQNGSDGVTTYFVRNEKYFSRDGLYGTAGADYPDNALRFSFFSKAALAAVKAVGFRPDIIHCNDWQSALIPLYLRSRLADDAYYGGIKTLFTVHNLAYQGVFGKKSMRGLGVPPDLFNMNGLEFHGKVNFMKAGIIYSDAISTVSRRYAREVMTPEYGCGLEGLLKAREHDLSGILNGVDYDVWSPEKDRFITPNYGTGSIENKRIC